MKIKKPSAQQLAAIIALNQEIIKLRNNINRPYATFITIIIMPLIVNMLFMQSWSPFHETYIEAEKERNEYFYNLIQNKKYELEKTLLEIEKHLMSLSELGDYKKRFGSAKSINDIIGNIESIAKNHPETIVAINKLKKSLFSIYNNFFYYVSSVIGKNAPSLKVDRDFFALYNNTGKAYRFEILWINTNNIFRKYKEGLNYINKMELFKKNLVFFGKEVLFYQSLAISLILQYGIFSPLLNYSFPQGLFQYKPPKKPQILDHSNAQIYIDELNKYHINLSKSAKRNIKISRYSLPLFIGLGIYLFSALAKSPYLIIIALNLVITALAGIQKELVDLYKKKCLSNNIAQTQLNITKAFRGLSYQSELKKHFTLEATYFVINFEKLEISENSLTAKMLANLFIKCCFVKRINILSQRGSSLAISADNLLDYTKLDSLKKLFDQAIERQVLINILKNQLNSLMEAFKNKYLNFYKIFVHGYDNLGLPWLKIEISLDGLEKLNRNYISQLKSLLKKLFADLDYKLINESNESLQISLEGFKALNKEKLEELTDGISHISIAKESFSVFNELNTVESNYKRQIKSQKNMQQKKSEPVPIKILKKRIIEWPFGKKYESQDENCKIYPLPFGGYESATNFERARIFFTNEIEEENIPVNDPSLRNNIFTKIENMVKAPKIVAKKGYQGFVFWEGSAIDVNSGKPFEATLKGKMMGEKLGDARLFCDKIISKTGEILIRVRGVKPHAH